MPNPLVSDGKLNAQAAAEELRRCLDVLIAKGRFRLNYHVQVAAGAQGAAEGTPQEELETPDVTVNFDGPDKDLLLERGAELLKALEHVAVRWLKLDPQFYDRIRFDCGTYRSDHLAELKLSAEVAAGRVRETRTPFRFNPMPARERRIIHLALKDQPGIRTASEGQGDERRLVVFPA